MCQIEKYFLTYQFETFFETYDKEEAENLQKNFNNELQDKGVEIVIQQIAPEVAVKELLSLIKARNNLIEVQSQNFKKMKAQQGEETENFLKTIDKKDEMLKAQGQLVVELQKKCEEMHKILNLPQNRAQRDLLKQMERCKQLERERGEK